MKSRGLGKVAKMINITKTTELVTFELRVPVVFFFWPPRTEAKNIVHFFVIINKLVTLENV